MFEMDIPLHPTTTMFTVLEGNIQVKSKWHAVTKGPNTRVLEHTSLHRDKVLQVVEACAGLGAMGEGFRAAGAQTVAYVENNERFAAWLRSHSKAPVIQSDVSQLQTIAEVFDVTGGSTTIGAGVSCQPFSKLGDRREEADPRSSSFWGTLRLAFLTRAPLIILECTQEVMTSPWAQDMLKNFARKAGYKLAQNVLNLHTLWPSTRTRWWATLAHPDFMVETIPSLPILSFRPALLNVMSSIPAFPEDEIKQLLLDGYELRIFDSQPGGLPKYVIDYMKPAPTATHSWGTQLSGCHCLCRSSGFNPSRIDSRGLYGVVVPMGHSVEVGSTVYHQMRFPHPREVALWNALRPDYVADQDEYTLKLELAGVGQLASPLQAAWVLGNAFQQASVQGFEMTAITPQEALHVITRDVLAARDKLWKMTNTPYMEAFVVELRKLLAPETVPIAAMTTQEPSHETEEPLTQLIQKECERVDPPIIRSSSSDHAHEQDSMRDAASEIPAESQTMTEAVRETHASHQNAHVSTLPTYATNGGVSMFACPFQAPPEEVPRNTEVVEAPGSPDPIEPATSPADSPMSHHSSFVQDHHTIMTEPEGKPMDDAVMAPMMDETPDQDARSELGENALMPADDFPPFDQDDLQSPPQDQDDIPPTCPWESASTVQIWIGHAGCPLTSLQVPADTTVGMVAYAEEKITKTSGKFKPTDAVGWVADDEMTWYMHMLSNHGNVTTTAPMILGSHNDPLIFGRWIVAASSVANQTKQTFVVSTVCWYNYHWFPIRVEVTEEVVQVTTTHFDENFVKQMLCRSFGEDHQIQCRAATAGSVMRSMFPADCGFQAMAWIMGQSNTHEGIMNSEEAFQWRVMFAQQLRNQGQTDHVVQGLILGGMPADGTNQLREMLLQHGVANERVGSVVQHLTQSLGPATIAQVMAAPHPWRDLKSRASALTPPYQIVMSDELQAQIDKRAAMSQPVGKKANKRQNKPHARPSVTLKSSQVAIPDGLFQQSDGIPLSQISLHQVQQRQRGVVLANIHEAEPFFKLQDKICREGIALIVLDLYDPKLPDKHQKVKFPAICAETREPMIIEGAMFQLGHMDVARTMPKEMVKVAQVQTMVIRAMIHRDQFQHDWQAFVKSPVRALMALPEFQHANKEGVLDVFDRQEGSFMNHAVKAADSPMMVTE
eukprot:Skav226938  [mRNA]  locus=scaffold965:288631:292409:- [translate_table: standard]